MNVHKLFIYLFICLISISSCQENSIKDLRQVIGTYKFVYPSGEIEIIKLLPDTTYSHLFYKSELDYIKSFPLHKYEKNKWKLNVDVIEFQQWIQFCDFNNPRKISLSPEKFEYMNGRWINSSKDHNAIIDMNYDKEYWLVRIN